MRFLITSDWHLDATTAGMRRGDDLDRAADRVVDLAIARSVDRFIHLGDVADPDCGSALVHVYEILLGKVRRLVRHGTIQSNFIAGNHDTIEDGSGRTTISPLRNAGERVFVYEEPALITWGDVQCCFLPFPARVLRYDPEAFMREHPFDQTARVRMVVGHCTSIDGVQLGSETYDMTRGAELMFPLAECRKQNVTFMANGHFHKQQVTESGIHIPGTLERLRFDEETNEPGVMIVDL